MEKNNLNQERVSIFIDGSNLYNSLKAIKEKIDFEKLISSLTGKRKLITAFYYIASLDINHNKDKYWEHQRFLENLRKIPNFKVVLCRMKKHKKNKKDFDFEVKGDDVCLTIDLISGAYENLYDTAVIISGDEDFVPAVKKIQTLGKKAEDAYFLSSSSDYLRQSCNSAICLNKEIEKLRRIKKDPALSEDHTGEIIN